MTNLGNLDRIRHNHGLADGWITGGRRPSIGAEGSPAPAGRCHVAEATHRVRRPPAREASVPAPQGPRRRAQDLADGGFSVTNLGNLDRSRHNQGLADGGDRQTDPQLHVRKIRNSTFFFFGVYFSN